MPTGLEERRPARGTGEGVAGDPAPGAARGREPAPERGVVERLREDEQPLAQAVAGARAEAAALVAAARGEAADLVWRARAAAASELARRRPAAAAALEAARAAAQAEAARAEAAVRQAAARRWEAAVALALEAVLGRGP